MLAAMPVFHVSYFPIKSNNILVKVSHWLSYHVNERGIKSGLLVG